jgi:tRNA threonylcarbamoyladenosine biosynthesis protein TsaE
VPINFKDDSFKNGSLVKMVHRSIDSFPLVLALPNPEATHQLGFRLGQSLSAGSLLLLEGDLGSGKTTLVQGIGKGLGISDPIASPTFILVNEYLEGRIPLYHFDLYRLEPSEVDSLYLETYWDGSEHPLGIVAIEWAERLPHLPANYLRIQLSHTSNGERKALFTPIGNFSLEGLFAAHERNLSE